MKKIMPIVVMFSISYLGISQDLLDYDLTTIVKVTTAELEKEINPQYLAIRGYAYRKLNKLDLAESDLNQAINLSPNNPDYYYWRGEVFYDKGDLNKALIDYNRAINLDPNNSSYYVNRGLLFEKKDNEQKALTDYTTAININDENLQARTNRALLYDRLGAFSASISDWTHLIQANPANPIYYNDRGITYLNNNNSKAALLDFKVASKYGDNPLYLTNTARAFKELNQLDSAIFFINKSLDYRSDIAYSYKVKGDILDQRGNHKEACENYRKALELGYKFDKLPEKCCE